MTLIITGKNTVNEAMKVNRKIHELYVLKNSNKDLVRLAYSKKIKVKELDKQDLSLLLPNNNQGIGALIDDYKYVTLENALNKPNPNKVFMLLMTLFRLFIPGCKGVWLFNYIPNGLKALIIG